MSPADNTLKTETLERPADSMEGEVAPGLDPHLSQWVASCLFDGFEPEAIVAKLTGLGVEGELAERGVEEIRRDPVFRAGWTVARRRRKLVSLLDVLARQLRHSPVAEGIPVLEKPSPHEFFADYYFANRPVLVKGLMETWPALGRWTPEHFAERFGETMVEVTADRDSDPRYEDRFNEHRRQMTLSRFVEEIREGSGNDLYIVAKNRLLDNPEMAELLEEFDHPEGFLDPARPDYTPRLWLGGAGTVTPLHHDGSNIFFGQLYGRKLVRLIPPFELENVYNDRACFSSVDLDAPDHGRYPKLRDVLVLETMVEPGDFLLLPVGWWHMVRSLDVSVSLSFQNFSVPGGPVAWHHAW
jgi:hypothetical protein